MKKIYVLLLTIICTIGMVACGTQDASQNMAETKVGSEKNTLQNEEKNWSEREITDMYYGMANGEIGLKYLDCVTMPDLAADRVGAVLFQNTETGTTEIGFFDKEGFAQQCGIYAEAAESPDLTYLGEGTVTFKLVTDEHVVYNCNVNISVEDGNVAFVITDDLEDIFIDTPENVYVTFQSGADTHEWELSEDEINSWVDWMNNLDVSPINLEESKMLIDYMYNNGSIPQYSFDIGREDSLERIAYFEVSLEHGYIHMDNIWYQIDNPTEPFNKY